MLRLNSCFHLTESDLLSAFHYQEDPFAPFHQRTKFGQFGHFVAASILGNYGDDASQPRRKRKLRKTGRQTGIKNRRKPASRKRATNGKRKVVTGGGKRCVSKSPSPGEVDEECGVVNPYYNLTFLNYMLKHVRLPDHQCP